MTIPRLFHCGFERLVLCHNAGSFFADNAYWNNFDHHVLRNSIELTSVCPTLVSLDML